MPSGADLADQARRWMGQRYRFGAEQGDCTPRDTDCSELVEAACRCLGVTPTMPDGSGNQFDHCDRNGGRIPFDQAAATVGALLFKSYTDEYPPGDRNSGGIYHVAIVAGPDRTVEACCDDGDKLVERSISGRSWYVWGGLAPGVTYSDTEPQPRRKDGDMLVTRNTKEIYLLSGGRLVYIYDPNALPGLIHILGQPCLVDEHTWASMVTAYGEPS